MTAQYAFDVFRWPRDVTEERLVRFALDDNLVAGWYEHVGYGTGGGGITVHGDHEDATEANIFKRAWVRFMRIDTDPEQEIGGFYLEEGDFVALSRRERGGRLLTFTGRGGLAALERYTLGHSIYAPGQDYRGTGPNVPDMWTWRGEPWGAMLVRFIEEGLNAPGAPFTNTLTADFNRDLDSNGNGWNELTDYQTRIGTNGLDLFGTFMQMGAVVQCNGSGLISAYRNLAGFRTDRTSSTFASGKLRFEAGVNIIDELPKRLHASSERTHVLTRRGDGQYQTFTAGGSGDPFYGKLEIPHTSDPTAVAALAQQWLEKRAQYLNQATVRHIIGDDATAGLYAPGPAGDYWVLDLATLHTGDAEHDFDEQAIEVAAIRFEHDDAGNWFARTDLGAQYVPTGVDRLSESIYSTIISTPHTHPELLCQPTIPPGDETYTATRLYPTGNGASVPVAYDDLWDEAASTVRIQLSTTPGITGASVGVNPWSQAPVSGPVDARLVQWQWALPGTGTLQGWFRGFAEVQSRWGVGINESAQDLIGQAVVKVVSSDGSTVRGVAYAGHDLGSAGSNKKWPPSAEQPGNGPPRSRSLIPLSEYDSALGVALTPVEWQSGDVLVIEQGVRSFMTSGNGTGAGIHVHITAGADMPETEDLTDNLRMWYEIVTISAEEGTAGVIGGGHSDMVGDSPRAARCGHKHHVLRTTMPGPLDDLEHGYPAGTAWLRVDDVDNPTVVFSRSISLRDTNGDALWVLDGPNPHSHAGALLPAGGTDGQVLTKQSDDDYDVDWETPPVGGGSLSVEEDGDTPVDDVDHIVFDNDHFDVTDDTGGQVTVALKGQLAPLELIVDGGGSEIVPGVVADMRIPFACTIQKVTLLADQSGSIVVDIWKDTLANFPPTDADSITASAPPTISGDDSSEDATLSGWTTTINAGDILRFNVDSVTDIERVTLVLDLLRT